MSAQTEMCERANRFIDGELAGAEDESFRNHLADCAACQKETEAALVLEFLVEQAADRADVDERLDEPNAPPTPWWKRRIVWVAVPGLIAAAAAVLLWVNRSESTALEGDALAVRFESALRPTRSIEARLAFSGADSYREYDVPRASATTGTIEKIPASVLAGFENEKTTEASSALAAAYTLMGATELAEQILAEREAASAKGAAETATTLSDRAALALGANQPSRAVLHSSAAIVADDTLAAAKWNYALALSKLNLPLAAADAFDIVVKLGEPGWSNEAEKRAKTLRANYEERKARWQRGTDAIEAFATGGPVPDDDTIRSVPGLVRLSFYDAVRSTDDEGRLEELAKFAATLDRSLTRTNDYSFARFVRTVRTQRTKARKSLAARYGALRASFGKKLDSSLIADALEAKQNDIALGALYWEPTLSARARKLYLELGKQSKDQWLELLAVERVVRDDVLAGKPLEVIKRALPALAECEASPFEFRCTRIEYWLSLALVYSHDVSRARQHAKAGFQRAQRRGDWVMEVRFLGVFAQIEGSQDDVLGSRLALSQAFVDEQRGRSPGCEANVYYSERLADALINNRLPDRASVVLARLDRECPDAVLSLERLHLDAHLVGTNAQSAEAVLAGLEKIMLPKMSVNDRAIIAHVGGRALLQIDFTRAERKLEQAIELADTSQAGINGRGARGWSFALLVEASATRKNYRKVASLLGRELGVDSSSCTLAISLETVISIAAIDQAGIAIGGQSAIVDSLGADTEIVPKTQVDHLRGCELIDVLARPPFLGRALLPPDLHWRFRLPKQAMRESSPRRSLTISAPTAPAELGLAPLTPSPKRHADVFLSAREATPARVISELERATFVEIHAHGLLNSEGYGGASIVLAPGSDGKFALSANDLKANSLLGNPIVVLSACQAAIVPRYQHMDLGLAGAFLAAGASAVVASPDPIPDRDAYIFFDSLRTKIENGAPVAKALGAARDSHPDLSGWTDKLVVFE